MRTKVLAVDPGGTTGWVLFYPISKFDPTLGDVQIEVLDWGEEPGGSYPFLQRVAWPLKTTAQVTNVVIERFVPRAGVRTWEPDAVEIAGGVKWMWTPENYAEQDPGAAKSFGSDKRLNRYRDGAKPVGKGGKGHALDALRHALLWTATRWTGV